MSPLTDSQVREMVDGMVRELSDGHPYRLLVRENPQQRLIEIWWDSLVEREDHRFACRATAVDIADTEEMVRYRVRAMFVNDADFRGRYEVSDITVADHPNEPPPYEVRPT